jgi:hypothetical protein
MPHRDYREFPFDTQYLVIEITNTQEPDSHVSVVPSATSKRAFIDGPGDQLSTWDVDAIEISTSATVIGTHGCSTLLHQRTRDHSAQLFVVLQAGKSQATARPSTPGSRRRRVRSVPLQHKSPTASTLA